MMKYLSIGIRAVRMTACQHGNVIESKADISVQPDPRTQKIEQKDDFFGTEGEDPYRWLEDDLSQETKNWVKAEHEVTEDYLNQIPFRENIRKRLEHLWDYEKVSSPFTSGDYIYFFKNDGLQNQSVLYR